MLMATCPTQLEPRTLEQLYSSNSLTHHPDIGSTFVDYQNWRQDLACIPCSRQTDFVAEEFYRQVIE